jgi:hypothetical protein
MVTDPDKKPQTGGGSAVGAQLDRNLGPYAMKPEHDHGEIVAIARHASFGVAN